MIQETAQLAAEHGTRSAVIFWQWEIALEMFLGGTAGALMLFGGMKRFSEETSRILHKATLGCLLLAGALLFLDLGAKLQAYRFLSSWRPDSVMFWGSWILALSIGAVILRLRLPGAMLGFGLMVYPGLLLTSMATRLAWRGPWVSLEFLLLSLASGAAVLMLIDPPIYRRSAWVRPAGFCVLCSAFVARIAILYAGQA